MGGVLRLGELYPGPRRLVRVQMQVPGGHHSGQHCETIIPKQSQQSSAVGSNGPLSRGTKA